jgi:hypothetical protein
MDQAKVETFAGKIMDILNGGMLSLMMSIGHQTGLFEAMADSPPSTSEQIAEVAGLNERYVREWLTGRATNEHITRSLLGANNSGNLTARNVFHRGVPDIFPVIEA